MEHLATNLGYVLKTIPFFALLFGAVLLGKVFLDRTTRYSLDHELTQRDNHALGASFSLYLLGLTFALLGSLNRRIDYDLATLLIVAGSCLLAIILMRASLWIVDHLMLSEFHVDTELIRDRNVGTGFVVGGCCVSTGLMINGAMTIEVTKDEVASHLATDVRDTLILFVLGQAILIGGAKLFRLLTRYDVHEVIEKHDNHAVGLAYGGYLVGIGIIVRAACLLETEGGLWQKIVTMVVIAVLGVGLLSAARIFADRAMLPQEPLAKEIVEDRNPSAGAVAASCFICAALAYSWILTA